MTEAKRRQAAVPKESSGLRDLFEQHGAFVCRSLRMLGVREADLDDALQEVFVVVFQRMHDYEERGRARAWLYSISTRIVHSQRRKQGRRHEDMAAALPEATAEATQLAQLADREALALGQRLLAQLPREQRDVFWLYEVEDVPMLEIARALECPLQTAYSRLHTARERILAAVQRAAAEDPDHA